MRFLLALILAASASAVHAQQQMLSGDSFLVPCKDAINSQSSTNMRSPLREGVCLGSVQTLMFVGNNLIDPLRFCVPRTATVGQATRVIIQSMEQNPQTLHLDFETLAIGALQRAWPCPK
jgi:hypothetical protein